VETLDFLTLVTRHIYAIALDIKNSDNILSLKLTVTYRRTINSFQKDSKSNYHTINATNISSDNIYTYILGPYVARFCMDLAIQKAKTAGIGFVSCRGKYYNE
jgi:hypothetical protein